VAVARAGVQRECVAIDQLLDLDVIHRGEGHDTRRPAGPSLLRVHRSQSQEANTQAYRKDRVAHTTTLHSAIHTWAISAR
jgi:hypothetical protein